ncbi:MAG: tetratricopeptide repeat protein [Pseudomonadota bacterium]
MLHLAQRILFAIAVGLAVSACSATGSHNAYVDANEPTSWFGKDRHDPVEIGKLQYRKNNFGLAEKNFREAVEAAPDNAEAWLGLAASYDQLGRFDLADRAYDEAEKIKGPLPVILNNRGYSYYLRGDVKKARKALQRAASGAPENQHIQGNIDLLNRSAG